MSGGFADDVESVENVGYVGKTAVAVRVWRGLVGSAGRGRRGAEVAARVLGWVGEEPGECVRE